MDEKIIKPFDDWWKRWGKYCLITSPDYDPKIAEVRLFCLKKKRPLPENPPKDPAEWLKTEKRKILLTI